MAGLLMFGKGLPIRERFDNLRMDYIDKSNLIGDQRYSDRLTYDGTWENNLFNFIRMVVPRLTRELPRPFQMDGILRRDDDRFVLTNPGLLKLPLDQIYAGGESKARNQQMQNMLRMIGYGENLGSGFPLILNAWNEKHWLKPELIEQPELMQVKLILHIENKRNDTKNDTKELSERQAFLLESIKNNTTLTISQMTQKTKMSKSTILRDLAMLQKKGFLFREGSRKGGQWVIFKQD